MPEKVAIVGAGYIAVEMAGMFHHLGSETHLFIRHDNFLRNFDPMIQEKIMSEYERQYVLSVSIIPCFEQVSSLVIWPFSLPTHFLLRPHR